MAHHIIRTPGQFVMLDGELATVIASCGEWAWVAKHSDPFNPETVSHVLLEDPAPAQPMEA